MTLEVADEGRELNRGFTMRGERTCLLRVAGLNDLLWGDFGDPNEEIGPLTGARSSGMLRGGTGML